MADLNYNARGGLAVDLGSLHASDGYKRQIDALVYLRERRCCQACRGYSLEARWCHLCGGKGYVDEVATTREGESA